jgi:serine/threonine protein kinase
MQTLEDDQSFVARCVYPDPYKEEDGGCYDKNYTRHLFHYVNLGDIFAGRYEIIQKLGCGSFSTVWLASDLRYSYCRSRLTHRTDRAVALKVLSTGEGKREVDVLLRLKTARHLPGGEHVVHLLDHFEHTGPNGVHLCFVMEYM